MTKDSQLSFTLRVVMGLAAFGLTLFFINTASRMVNALFLGYIIVLSASPLLFWLKSKKVPDWLSFTVTLAVILGVFLVLVVLLATAVNRLAEAIPTYAESLNETVLAIEELLAGLGITGDSVNEFFNILDPAALVQGAFGFIAGLLGALSDVLLVGLIVVFLLVDTYSIPQKLMGEIEKGNSYVQRVASFSTDLRQYVYITTIVALVTGFLDTIFFIIMGVDFPVLWGILAFLLSYVPTIGFWLAAIPPTLLALLESGPIAALIVFLGIVLINGFAENVVKPRYMGKGLNLSPFTVVFSVVFWTAVLGPMGAILSIPMTLFFKVLVLEVDDENSWIAELMSAGNEEQAPAEPSDEETALASELESGS